MLNSKASSSSPAAGQMTKSERIQTVSALEHAAEAEKRSKLSEKHRKAMQSKTDYALHGENTHHVMRTRARDLLAAVPAFNVTRDESPAHVFVRIITPEVMRAAVLHMQAVGPWDVLMDPALSLRTLYMFLAQRIFIWRFRSTHTGRSVRDALAPDQNPPPKVTKNDGREIDYGDFMLPRDFYSYINERIRLQPSLIRGAISANLFNLLSRLDVLIVLDEKKQPYSGHAPCGVVIRGKFVLWMTQVAVTVPGSILPLVFRMIPFDKYVTKSRAELVEAALAGLPPTAFTCDYYYASRQSVRYLHENGHSFWVSVNKEWFKSELMAVSRYVTDEGKAKTMSYSDVAETTSAPPLLPPSTSSVDPPDAPLLPNDDDVPVAAAPAASSLSADMETSQAAAAAATTTTPSTTAGPAGSKRSAAERGLAMRERNSADRAAIASVGHNHQGALERGGVTFSAHWHQERNKPSTGVRMVASNAYTQRTVRGRKQDTAVINSHYSSMYGVGSDMFNRAMYATRENGWRPSGHIDVFSHMALHSVLLNVWSLMQWTARYKVKKEVSRMKPWENFLYDLVVGLYDYAATLPTDAIVSQIFSPLGCGCEDCGDGPLEPAEHIAAVVRDADDEIQLVHRVESKMKQSTQERRKRRKSLQSTVVASAERKSIRLGKLKRRSFVRFSGGDDDDEEEEDDAADVSDFDEKCDGCARMILRSKLLGCEGPCQRWLCAKCAGVYGRGVSSARKMVGWLCPHCEFQRDAADSEIDNSATFDEEWSTSEE